MLIDIDNHGLFFSLPYLLSFIVVFVWVLAFSLKKGYPLRSVLLMLTTISLFTVLGSRLFTIPIHEWNNLIFDKAPGNYQNRSAVGGLLFGLAALIFTQKFFGFGKPMLNLYAIITPIAFGIQKLGCFFNGCCYGLPSNLPWAVKYNEGTMCHFNHYSAGMIDEGANFSLAVHPVQLYEVLLLFLVSFIVWKSINLWKKSGSSLLFSLSLFFIFRFGMEFFRDPASSTLNSNLLLGIRMFVWTIMIIALACILLLLVYEKWMKVDPIEKSEFRPDLRVQIIYILVLSFLIFLFRGLFTKFEFIALETRFVPAILLTAYYIYKAAITNRYRLATSMLLILPFILMSQSIPTDSIKTKVFKRIDAGTSIGSLYNTVRYNPVSSSCGNSYTRDDYKQIYRIAGAGYSRVKEKGNRTETSGINIYGGLNREMNLTKDKESNKILVGVNPYYNYEMNWLGIGLGLHAGNIHWIPLDPIDERTFDNGTKFSPVMPEGYIRIGPKRIIDLKLQYGYIFPSPYPAFPVYFSIGTGLGQWRDYSLRLGISPALEDYYLTGEARLKENLGLNFMVLVRDDNYRYYENRDRTFRMTFGMNYRFQNK